MRPLEQAWQLLKMPVVDTDVPGLQMAYMEGDPRLWTYEHGMLGGADQQVWDAEESHPRGIIGNVPSTQAAHVGDTPVDGGQVTQMSPNEYFDALRNVKRDTPYRTEGSNKRYYHDIPDASAEYRWPDKGEQHIQDMVQGISEGQVMGMPSIDVSTGGQEGGHRMEALRQMGHGDTPVPVMTYKGESMDIAWKLLKEAIPIMPYTREQDEFKAYRAVPTSRVQQILLEGLQPLPLDRTVMNERAGSDFERINSALGIPLDEDDMELFEMENRRRQRFGQKPLPIRPPQESAIWTFGKRPNFPKTTHREMMEESLYNPLTSPLLAAQHFGDSFMSSRPTSIIASRVKPPGKIVEDTEFGRERGLARPQASFRGIAPEHLVEVMPVSDWNQTPITYDQWGQVNNGNGIV